jgi:hypothetical protein
MKLSTSKRLDAQVKREKFKELALSWKLKHFSDEEIAAKLFDEGIGVEAEGELTKPYASSYVSKVIRESLKEIAADRTDYGKSLAVILEADLDELLEFWRPLALDPEAPSVKAADLVRKIIQQKAEMCGANAPILQQVEIKYQNDVENFVNVLRALMPEEHFNSVILAIDQATNMNAEYWSEQKLLKSAEDATIDTVVLE